MTSPFYKAEQNKLYPHKKICLTLGELENHVIYLIDNSITTMEKLQNTKIKDLINKYFTNANPWDIYKALNNVENKISHRNNLNT